MVERRELRRRKEHKRRLESERTREHIIYPRTPKGWLRRMVEKGQTHRKAPDKTSDLRNPLSRDESQFKPERVALAGIMSLRAYQIAKPEWIEKFNNYGFPSTETFDSVEELKKKNQVIGEFFIHTMMSAIKKDEDNPNRNIQAHGAYNRLDDILYPLEKYRSPHILVETSLGRQYFPNASTVMKELWMGVKALPGNTEHMIEYIIDDYQKQHDGIKPDKRTVIAIMRNSYKSFSKPMAELHFLESFPVTQKEKKRDNENPPFRLASLAGDHLELSEETKHLIKKLREETRSRRSATTRCAFMLDPKEAEIFLDEPADFDDALKDAFDTHMDLLAA